MLKKLMPWHLYTVSGDPDSQHLEVTMLCTLYLHAYTVTVLLEIMRQAHMKVPTIPKTLGVVGRL